MFYDEQGRPDPNGKFEKAGGKLILRDGAYVRFDMTFVDSASKSSVFLMDDGAKLAAVARARMIHQMTHAHLGDQAPEFTADDEARALSGGAAPGRSAATAASLTADADAAGVVAAAARQRMIDSLTSGGKR